MASKTWQEYTLEEAYQTIERMRVERNDCSSCALIPYSEEGLTDEMKVDGWEHYWAKAAYLKRCEPCSVPGSRWPWAKRLDVDRVLAWFRSRPNPIECVYLGDLEELTK